MIAIPGTQKCLLVGGEHDMTTVNTAYIYDYATDTWTQTGNNLSQSRAYHRLTLCGSGTGSTTKTLAVGGEAGGVARDQLEVYDFNTDTWSRLKDAMSANVDLNTARSKPALASNSTFDKFIIAGGGSGGGPYSSMELITVNSSCASATHVNASADMRVTRTEAVAMREGAADTFLIVGGSTSGSNAVATSDQVAVTNWTTGAVTVAGSGSTPGGPSMTSAHRNAQLVVTSSTQTAVVCGLDTSGNPIAKLQKWSTSLHSWRPEVSLAVEHDRFVSGYLASEARGIVAGGWDGTQGTLSTEDF